MSPLNNRQKELIFDYCLGIISQEEAEEAEMLIETNEEAKEILFRVKSSFAPLDSWAEEACPEEFVENTVIRLMHTARASQLRLEGLLAKEQALSSAAGAWWAFAKDFGGRLAMAALFMVVGGLVLTSWNTVTQYGRQKSWQNQCAYQMGNIWQGMSNYSADHEGQVPVAARSNGEPWWKLGYQGKENQSNTRSVWLLVKNNYVKSGNFICPGRTGGQTINMSPELVQMLNDFPSRAYVSYSFRVVGNKAAQNTKKGLLVLMADVNPVFERMPSDFASPLQVELTKKLMNSNSMNHQLCGYNMGQNVVLSDGSVRFLKSRKFGVQQDDIFTVQDKQVYKGDEVPVSSTDVFVAP